MFPSFGISLRRYNWCVLLRIQQLIMLFKIECSNIEQKLCSVNAERLSKGRNVKFQKYSNFINPTKNRIFLIKKKRCHHIKHALDSAEISPIILYIKKRCCCD